MQAHKREIVGKFLGKELGPKEVLARKLEICTEMGRACPADLFLNQAKDPCGLCRRLVRDLEYEYAVQGPGPAKKPPAAKKSAGGLRKSTRTRLFGLLAVPRHAGG